jgi:hypothetical protein
MARLPGRCGRSRLTHVLAAWRPQPFLRSEAERLFLELCDRNGLPRPLVNASAAGYEVDFLWPQAGLVVEVDGAATHMTRKAFEGDRRRDRRLAAHGLQVLRVTWPDLQGDGRTLAREIRAVLAARGAC